MNSTPSTSHSMPPVSRTPHADANLASTLRSSRQDFNSRFTTLFFGSSHLTHLHHFPQALDEVWARFKSENQFFSKPIIHALPGRRYGRLFHIDFHRATKNLSRLYPSVIVINLGDNNLDIIKQHLAKKAVLVSLRYLISKIAHTPHYLIIIGIQPRPCHTAIQKFTLADLDNRILVLAHSGAAAYRMHGRLRYIPSAPWFKTPDGRLCNSLFDDDGKHLSVTGAKLLAWNLCSVTQRCASEFSLLRRNFPTLAEPFSDRRLPFLEIPLDNITGNYPEELPPIDHCVPIPVPPTFLIIPDQDDEDVNPRVGFESMPVRVITSATISVTPASDSTLSNIRNFSGARSQLPIDLQLLRTTAHAQVVHVEPTAQPRFFTSRTRPPPPRPQPLPARHFRLLRTILTQSRSGGRTPLSIHLTPELQSQLLSLPGPSPNQQLRLQFSHQPPRQSPPRQSSPPPPSPPRPTRPKPRTLPLPPLRIDIPASPPLPIDPLHIDIPASPPLQIDLSASPLPSPQPLQIDISASPVEPMEDQEIEEIEEIRRTGPTERNNNVVITLDEELPVLSPDTTQRLLEELEQPTLTPSDNYALVFDQPHSLMSLLENELEGNIENIDPDNSMVVIAPADA